MDGQIGALIGILCGKDLIGVDPETRLIAGVQRTVFEASATVLGDIMKHRGNLLLDSSHLQHHSQRVQEVGRVGFVPLIHVRRDRKRDQIEEGFSGGAAVAQKGRIIVQELLDGPAKLVPRVDGTLWAEFALRPATSFSLNDRLGIDGSGGGLPLGLIAATPTLVTPARAPNLEVTVPRRAPAERPLVTRWRRSRTAVLSRQELAWNDRGRATEGIVESLELPVSPAHAAHAETRVEVRQLHCRRHSTI